MQALFFRCFYPDILKSTYKRPHYSIPVFKTQDGGSIYQICFLYFTGSNHSSAIVLSVSTCYKWKRLFYFKGNGCFLTASVLCFCRDLNRSLLFPVTLPLAVTFAIFGLPEIQVTSLLIPFVGVRFAFKVTDCFFLIVTFFTVFFFDVIVTFLTAFFMTLTV